ncbi:hypothetical protein ACLOJK_033687 [Asimina triloba]
MRLFKGRGSSNDAKKTEMRDFVLHLEGEENLVQLIMKLGWVDTEKWVHKGRKNQLTHIRDLLKKSTVSEGFKGVTEFDSDQMPSVLLEEPPNCWALPLVTLSSIAIAIPITDGARIKPLLLGVNEGLKYVRLVERKLDMKGLPSSIREAADIVWLRVDLHHQWFDVDLAALAREEKDPKKIIEGLAESGKKYALEGVENGSGNKLGTAMKWSPKAVAGNSMYRICQTILMDYDNKFSGVDELFEWLCVLVSDIMGACLTNLPRVVSMECYSSAIQAKEDCVREAAYLLGEAESILDALGNEGTQFLGIDQNAYIDSWRLSKLKRCPSQVASTVSNGSMSNRELQISIQ